MSEVGTCSSPAMMTRRMSEIAELAREMLDTGEDRDVVDQVADLLDEVEDAT